MAVVESSPTAASSEEGIRTFPGGDERYGSTFVLVEREPRRLLTERDSRLEPAFPKLRSAGTPPKADPIRP
jgi:hypothetical protein